MYFTRTILELKPPLEIPKDVAATPFYSYHIGIETN